MVDAQDAEGYKSYRTPNGVMDENGIMQAQENLTPTGADNICTER